MFLTLYYLSKRTKELIFASFSRVSPWDDLVTVKYFLSVPEMNANKQQLVSFRSRSNVKWQTAVCHPFEEFAHAFASDVSSFQFRSDQTDADVTFKIEQPWEIPCACNWEKYIADFIIAARRALERDESIFWTLELATQGYACCDPPPLTTRRVIENHVIEREFESSRAAPAILFRSAYINISCINR